MSEKRNRRSERLAQTITREQDETNSDHEKDVEKTKLGKKEDQTSCGSENDKKVNSTTVSNNANLTNFSQHTGAQEFISVHQVNQALAQAQSSGFYQTQGQSAIFPVNPHYQVFSGPSGSGFIPQPNMYSCMMPYPLHNLELPSVPGTLTVTAGSYGVINDGKSSKETTSEKKIEPAVYDQSVNKQSCEEKKIEDLEFKIAELTESNRKLKATNRHLFKTNHELAVQLEQLQDNERIVDRLNDIRSSSHYESQRGSRGGSRGIRGQDSKFYKKDRQGRY